MSAKNQASMHSVAVSLLAIAVIVLAIKEPKNCVSGQNESDTSSLQSELPSARSSPATQRELRKF